MADTDKTLTEAQREQRRQAAQTHGAGSYLARTAAGQLITAAMRLCESEVARLFAEGGERAMVEAAAIRFDTAARLVWQHLERAEPHEIEPLLMLWRKLQRDAVTTWVAHRNMPSADDGALTPAKILESLSNDNR